MDIAELSSRLTTGCRILTDQDIVDAYGHLSARHPDNDQWFVINRGMSPALVTTDDFIVLDLNGQVISGAGVPNAEWPIHACIYQARPDVGSVLHSHTRLSKIFSLSSRKLRGLLMVSAPEWQGGLPVYRAPGLITNVDRGAALAEVLGESSAALLRGHGDVVVGADVTASVMNAVTLKLNADVYHEVLAHGDEPELWTDAELAQWTNPLRDVQSQAQLRALQNRAWDYYEARVDGRLARLLHPEL
ncbi:MAG: class II aldolase/adducin family protein [Chloroflexota bacterium]